MITNLTAIFLYFAAQAGVTVDPLFPPWQVNDSPAGNVCVAWNAPFPQPAATVSNAAIAAAWAQSQVPVTPGSVAYSGSVAAGTWIEVPGETKTFAVRATDAGDLMAVPAAESPHKTPAQIAALFTKQAATNATLRADIRALRLQVATNIADATALIAAGTNAIAELQALTFSTTPTKAQVTALRNEVVDVTRILNDSLRELKDAHQVMQDLRRVLVALYKEE